MTNCHVAEALAACALRFDDGELREAAGEFFLKFLRMMTTGGDPARPNSFEHYHPVTGEPSRYRGVDDYLHSWMGDLILKFAAGLCADDEGVTVSPFPGSGNVRVDGLFIRGSEFRVEVKGRKFSVQIGREKRSAARLGERLRFRETGPGIWARA